MDDNGDYDLDFRRAAYQLAVIDLSVPVDASTPLYADASGYTDPATILEPWINIGDHSGEFVSPFRVSRLSMGVHTGTHVDAPAHFLAARETVDALLPSQLVGRACVVDLSRTSADLDAASIIDKSRFGAARSGHLPLLLLPERGLGRESVESLRAWGPRLIACAGPLDADSANTSTATLLSDGFWLATDLSIRDSVRVRTGDLIVVAPLRLMGAEGSPCRVLAIRGWQSGLPEHRSGRSASRSYRRLIEKRRARVSSR